MTIDEILAERNKTHGSFEENAVVSQMLKDIIRDLPAYAKLTDVQREALDMICVKISRIVSGKADVVDHWRDIEGYAKLVADRLEGK